MKKYLVRVVKEFKFNENVVLFKNAEIILNHKDYETYKSKVKLLKEIIEFPNELSIVK